MFEPKLYEDEEWQAMSLRERLEVYISSRTDAQDYRERSDVWSDIMGLESGCYNGAINNHLAIVIEESITDNRYSTSIAEKHGLQAEYVELLKYIICGAGLGEYGTSPRGAWIERKYVDLVPALVGRIRTPNAQP